MPPTATQSPAPPTTRTPRSAWNRPPPPSAPPPSGTASGSGKSSGPAGGDWLGSSVVNSRVELDECFAGDTLDPDVWFRYYLPHWSSRAASAATCAVRGRELH